MLLNADTLALGTGGEPLAAQTLLQLGRPSALDGLSGLFGYSDYLPAVHEETLGTQAVPLSNVPALQIDSWWTSGSVLPNRSVHKLGVNIGKIKDGDSVLPFELYTRFERKVGAETGVAGTSLFLLSAQNFIPEGDPGRLDATGIWLNLGNWYSGKDNGNLTLMEFVTPTRPRTPTGESWRNTPDVSGVSALQIIAGENATSPTLAMLTRFPTIGLAIASFHPVDSLGFKTGLGIWNYGRQALYLTPRHVGYEPADSAQAIFISDWDSNANYGKRFGLLIGRDSNPSFGAADIEITAGPDSAIWPFIYRRGASGGVMGGGIQSAITDSGDIAGASVTLPLGGGLWLAGPNGATQIKATGSSIEFWVGGIRRGRVTAAGFQAG